MFDWLDGLSDAIGAAIADIVAFLQWMLQTLVAVFEFLYSLLVAVFNFFYSLAKTVGEFFVNLWENWIKGILQDIWGVIVKVHDWLENLLSPIINFLKQIYQWVNWFFTTYIKPFLTLLNHVRAFLNILAQFGVKWAAELDQWLGKIEAQIIAAFQKVEGYLNAIIGILNSLADPLGLFRGPTFVMSMRRIFPSFCRGVSGMPLGYFFPSPGTNNPAGWGSPGPGFNPSNSSMNPPPSTYLGQDDGLGDFGGVDPGDDISDADADDMQPLDFFNDDMYPDSPYDDPSDAADNAWTAILNGSIAGS
jgi:hypothetical protein